jgi:hypothetical protein
MYIYIGCFVHNGVNEKKGGTKSLLFGKFKIMLIVNERISLCYFNIVILSPGSMGQVDKHVE